MSIKCAMFDFGNVIGIFDTVRWYDFIRDHRKNCLDPHEMFSGSLKQNMIDFDTGKLSKFEYYLMTKEAYRLNVSMEEFFRMNGEILSVDGEMLKIIQDLRRRAVITILITNMNNFHADYVSENYPEVFESFDHVFVSAVEGIAKPDPEAWIKPLNWSGFQPGECLFIDDSDANIQVAGSLGIKCWHYNVTDKNWCMNGKIQEERIKFKNSINLLWDMGIIKPR